MQTPGEQNIHLARGEDSGEGREGKAEQSGHVFACLISSGSKSASLHVHVHLTAAPLPHSLVREREGGRRGGGWEGDRERESWKHTRTE